MKTTFAAACVLAGTLLLPQAGHAADSDKDRASPKVFVKDSAITIKIKAKLAEEKIGSMVHISVDTENKGAVHLGGTAKTQAEVDKAGAIARGVEGVVSVQNNIQVAGARGASSAGKTSGVAGASAPDRTEARIKDMHDRLKITPAQEDQWSKVAQVMRDNGKQMDAMTKARAEKPNMSAIDDLKSYGEITDAHADGIKKFASSFKPLYDAMPDEQKKSADTVFRRGGRKST